LLRAAGVLYCPTRNGLETVQALLAQGADVNAKDNLDSYQFSFAQNAQNIFRLLCKPLAYGFLQRKNFESTF
jgi:hypothetical protein